MTLPLPPKVKSPRHWLMGTAYYAQRDPLTWIPRWVEEAGELCTIHSPFGTATVVAKPELARQVLVERADAIVGQLQLAVPG